RCRLAHLSCLCHRLGPGTEGGARSRYPESLQTPLAAADAIRRTGSLSDRVSGEGATGWQTTRVGTASGRLAACKRWTTADGGADRRSRYRENATGGRAARLGRPAG